MRLSQSVVWDTRPSPSIMNSKRTIRLRIIIYLAFTITAAGVLTALATISLYRIGLISPEFRSSGGSIWILLTVNTLVAVIASSVVIRWVLEPIKDLSQAMDKVKEGDFTVRIEQDPDEEGELAELINNFNNMAEELGGTELLRSDFINDFSHEFKTPIVSIRGYARQLQRPDISVEERIEYARIIAEESDRLSNLSSNILMLNKVDNQRIVTNKTTFSLSEQLRNSLLLFEKQWTDKNLELIVEIEEVTYTSEEGLLSNVWNNLISNAIKFSNPGGQLTVTCGICDSNVVVSVSDTGQGMDEATAEHIFEKFYQGDSSHSREGNGLGLPLAKRIVTLCGGTISVKTAPDQGSTFTVHLPITDITV